MSYRVEWRAESAAYLRRLDPGLQRRVLQRVQTIGDDPLSTSTSKPLHGELAGMRSARIGGYRLVYHVSIDEQVVRIVQLGPRGDAYR